MSRLRTQATGYKYKENGSILKEQFINGINYEAMTANIYAE